MAGGARRFRHALSSLPGVRWFSRSLARRIVFSNLIGLVILLCGYWYLNQYKDWLVDAKVDSLTAQGEIIAQSIAATATLEGERPFVDPEMPPDAGFPLVPAGDNAFAALAFPCPNRLRPQPARQGK